MTLTVYVIGFITFYVVGMLLAISMARNSTNKEKDQVYDSLKDNVLLCALAWPISVPVALIFILVIGTIAIITGINNFIWNLVEKITTQKENKHDS